MSDTAADPLQRAAKTPEDLYARTADQFKEPPRGFWGTLSHLGPGLILVGSIVGSGELIMTTKLGAQAGFVFLWFVLISCVIKTVVQAELARHVISSGETILVMFNKLPGPQGQRPAWLRLEWLGIVVLTSLAGFAASTLGWTRGLAAGLALLVTIPLVWVAAAWWIRRRLARPAPAHPNPAASPAAGPACIRAARPRATLGWFWWVWAFCQMVMFINGGAIIGGAGQTLELAFRKPFGATDARVWTVVVALACAALLLSGRYKLLERVSMGLVSTFTLITVVCTVLLQWTGNRITWDDVAAGLDFGFPTGLGAAVILTALAMYAGTGIGTWEMMHYTYWCVEKGYARNTGANQPGDDWARRARGWIRVMYWDVLLTMVVYTISTICFYFLGAAILHARGLDPEGHQTLAVLQNIYTGSLGEWAATLFVVGGFMVLFSTTFSSCAGTSRLVADGLAVIGIIEHNDYHGRLRFIRFFVVFTLSMNVITYALLENPPLMLIIAAFVSVLLYPALGLGTLYLRYRGVDPRIRPSALTTLVLWVSAFAITVISPAAVLLILAIRLEWIAL